MSTPPEDEHDPARRRGRTGLLVAVLVCVPGFYLLVAAPLYVGVILSKPGYKWMGPIFEPARWVYMRVEPYERFIDWAAERLN